MSTKITDLTIEELEERIQEAVRKVLQEEDELSDEFAKELEQRLANPVWISHEEVWSRQSVVD